RGEGGPAQEEPERASCELAVDRRRDAQRPPAWALAGIHLDARSVAWRGQAGFGVGDGDGNGGGPAVGPSGRVEDVVAEVVLEPVLADEPRLGCVDDGLVGLRLG